MSSGNMNPVPEHVERHTHVGSGLPPTDVRRTTVALVGNPNVGKSVVFGHLSGLYAEVSNYPGTTVEVTRGVHGDFELFDTPGVYGISALSEEENVTRDVVLQADVVLNIVDAVHLERDLFLTQQLIDMGKRVSVLLNFMDEVRSQNIEIDTRLLSTYLGVPIFCTTAVTAEGFVIFRNPPSARGRGLSSYYTRNNK